jgi:arylsulfatase A-like enzyme
VGEAEHVAYLATKGLKPPKDDFERRPCPEFAGGQMIVKTFHPLTFVKQTQFGADDFMDVYWAREMSALIGQADVSRPQAFIFNAWAPHPPYFVPEPYFSMYDPAALHLPANVGQWYPGQPPFLLHSLSGRCVQLKADDWRKTWAAYFGLVTMVDDCMGRVIAALKERGVWDDALVIFTMDHGECLGSHSLAGKYVMYEESVHVPLFIKPPAPGKPAPGGPGRRRQFANHVDLAATICDYAGVEPPPGHQGRSRRSVVEDAATPWPDATFAEINGNQGRGYPSRAIFTERYKYIHHFREPDELYDMVADPLEARSLAALPEYQALKQELRGRLAQWMRESGDILDIERDAGFEPRDWARFTK